MVQVLPKVRSFGEDFGRAIGMGAGEGISSHMENRKKMAALKKENADILNATGIDLTGILDPDLRKETLKQGLIGQRKTDLQSQQQDFLSGLFPGQSPQASMGKQLQAGAQEEPQEQPQPQMQGFDPSSLSDADIAKATIMNPQLGSMLQKQKDSVITDKRERSRNAQTLTSQKQAETLPLRKQYADQAKTARDSIENDEKLIKLIRSGNLNHPLVVAAANKWLPEGMTSSVLSKDTQVYNSGLLQGYTILRKVFQGQTRVKELDLAENKMATLDKSDAAKEEILANQIKASKSDIILAKAARQIEKEHPNASYIEFEELVSERAKPEMDKLLDEILEENERIYLKYAPVKTSYIDQNGTNYKDVPKKDLEKFFKEAKENGIDLRSIK